MSEPVAVLEIVDVTKNYHGLRPLRLGSFVLRTGERVSIAGLDAIAAEVLVNLITGASLPDEGDIRVMGESTAAIATDTAWLASLDRFGFVSHRAVLLDGATVLQNLSLPFTLEIDPIPPDVRDRVVALADEVGLPASLLSGPAGELAGGGRMTVHLARALATDPALLLLEHPTASIEEPARAEFGAAVARVATRRRLALLALTQDESFARAVAGRRLTLDGGTGALAEARSRRWW